MLARRARSALQAGRVLHWPHRLDLSSLEACAAALVGEHDFTAFTPTETEHVRFEREVLAAFWRRSTADDGVLEFWIEADAFMRHMNRVLVGTMLEVAGGRRALRRLPGCSPAGPGQRPGRRRRRTGCTWPVLGTGASACCRHRMDSEPPGPEARIKHGCVSC